MGGAHDEPEGVGGCVGTDGRRICRGERRGQGRDLRLKRGDVRGDGRHVSDAQRYFLCRGNAVSLIYVLIAHLS